METPDASLVRRNQVVWRLLTRLWSEATKREEGQKTGGGARVETSDTSLVRGNQREKRGEERKLIGRWFNGLISC